MVFVLGPWLYCLAASRRSSQYLSARIGSGRPSGINLLPIPDRGAVLCVTLVLFVD